MAWRPVRLTASVSLIDRRSVRADAQEVGMIARLILQATGTGAAGVVRKRSSTKENGSQIKRHGGLADPVRTGKQVGMGQTVARQSTTQQGERLGLTENSGEGHGSEQGLLPLRRRLLGSRRGGRFRWRNVVHLLELLRNITLNRS